MCFDRLESLDGPKANQCIPKRVHGVSPNALRQHMARKTIAACRESHNVYHTFNLASL